MNKPIAPISSDSSHDLGNRNNLPGLLNQIIKKHMQGQVDNSLPALVVSFDQENNRVEVQPLIRILQSDGSEVSRGTLTVPVFNYGTNKMSLRFNLAAENRREFYCRRADAPFARSIPDLFKRLHASPRLTEVSHES